MSILRNIGHVLKTIFVGATDAAEAAGPTIGFLFPGWGTLFNLVAGSAAKAEQSFNPTGTIRGGGSAKKSLAKQDAESLFLQYEKISGNVVDRDAFIDGVVMAMNATTPQ